MPYSPASARTPPDKHSVKEQQSFKKNLQKKNLQNKTWKKNLKKGGNSLTVEVGPGRADVSVAAAAGGPGRRGRRGSGHVAPFPSGARSNAFGRVPRTKCTRNTGNCGGARGGFLYRRVLCWGRVVGWSCAMVLRGGYAMCGTALGYDATRALCDVGYCDRTGVQCLVPGVHCFAFDLAACAESGEQVKTLELSLSQFYELLQ
eukprot:2681478-Rhodomonas_salina.1